MRQDIEGEESLISFVYRLVQLNGYPSLNYLVSKLESPIGNVKKNEFIDNDLIKLSEMSGVSSITLNSASANFFIGKLGNQNYARYVVRNKVRFCSLCLLDNYYQRKHWGFQPLNICNEHGVVLIEKCPSCNYVFKIEDIMFKACKHCNSKLTSYNPRLIDQSNFYYNSQVKLFNMLYCENSLKTNNYSIKDFLDLATASLKIVIGMPNFLTNGNDIILPSLKKGESRTCETLSMAIANVFWMYDQFPTNFITVLNEFLKSNHNPKVQNRKKNAFEQIFNSNTFDFIYDAYKKYWLRKSDEGVIRIDFSLFKRDPNLLNERKNIRKEEFKRTAKMGTTKLLRLRAQKKLDIMSISSKKHLVNREFVEIFYENPENFVSKAEAGLILGIRQVHVNKLIDEGLLTVVSKESFKFPRISLNQVKELINCCRGRYTENEMSQLLRFDTILSALSQNGISIATLIKLTMCGQITPQSNKMDGTLRDNFYCLNEVKQCLSGGKDSNTKIS